MIFDSHAHYDDEAYKEDRDEVISKLKDYNVGYIVNIGASIESSANSIQLAEKYPFIYATIGVHPEGIATMSKDDLLWLEEHTANKKVVAIGEIGLDYFWNKENKEEQAKWFRAQIQIARENKLPMVIHSRDAAEDTIKILKDEKAEEIGGIIHCYSYSKEMMQEYLDLGFYFGIGGVITFKNARKLVEVVANLPMERIVLETDAPYLSPDPFRGKRNSSVNIKYVAEKIAEIKDIPVEQVIQIANENTYQAYHIERD